MGPLLARRADRRLQGIRGAVNVVQTGRGAKSEAVRQFLRSTLSDEFTFADIRTACPLVSDPTIRAVLKTLKEQGAVESQGTGRSAKWKRLNTDF
jgi:hypothetical protein